MITKFRGLTPGQGMLSLAFCLLCGAGMGGAQSVPVFSNTVPVQAAATEPTAQAPATPAPAPAVSDKTAAAGPTSPVAVPANANAPSAPATIPARDTNVVIAATLPEQLELSPALAEVVKLIQGGVNPDVVMAYVTNSTDLFDVGSEEILYLHDLGTPPQLITALIQKDSSPEAQARRKAMGATQPLPAGVALSTPATNVYPPTAAAPVADPPEPTPVAPPSSIETAAAPVANNVASTTPVVAPLQPASVTYFESELSPYGSWVYVSGYGRCWRPTVAVWNTGWQPYADGGRWLWTDNGWYWYSDYSWGWAPFHYGRWFSPPGLGWVWMPDVHWGPAWVSWRYTGSHCGWAPLPPSAHFVSGHGFYHHSVSVGIGFEFGLLASHYVFLPFDRFCDRRPYSHYIRGHHGHGHAIYRDSKVVNNYVVQNNTIINQGAGAHRVPAIARGDVKKVALRGTTEVRDLSGRRRESLGPDGQTLTVVRPTSVSVEGAPARPGSNVRPRVTRGTSQNFTEGSAATSGSLGSVPGGTSGRPAVSPRGSLQNVNRPKETPTRIDAPSNGRNNPGRDQANPVPRRSGVAETDPSIPSGSVNRPAAPQRRVEQGNGNGSGRREPIIITGRGNSGSGSATVQPSPVTPPVRQPAVTPRPNGGPMNVPQRAPQIQQPRREPVRVAPQSQHNPSASRPSFSAPAASARPSYSPPARIDSPRPAPAPSAPSYRSAPSRSESSGRVSSSGGNRGGGGEGRGGGGGGGDGGGRSGGRDRNR